MGFRPKHQTLNRDIALTERCDARPLHPPVIESVEILWNPFEDVVPRSTRPEREAAAERCAPAGRAFIAPEPEPEHKALAHGPGADALLKRLGRKGLGLKGSGSHSHP